MTVLFSDGFESGDLSSWSSSDYTTGDSIAVDATSVHTGTYGLHVTKLTSSDNGYGRCWRTYTAPASNFHSLKFDMKIISRAGDGLMRFAFLYQSGAEYQPKAALIWDGFSSQYKLTVFRRDGTSASAALSPQPTVGSYQTFEIQYDATGTDPIANMYMDSALVATVTDSTVGTVYQPNQVWLTLWETGWSVQSEVYYDNVSLADVSQAGASYTRSFSSSISSTVAVSRSGGFIRTLSTSNTHTASFTKGFFKNITSTISNSVVVSRSGSTYKRSLSSTIANSVALSKGSIRNLTSTIAHTATFARVASFTRSIATSALHVSSATRIGTFKRSIVSAITHIVVFVGTRAGFVQIPAHYFADDEVATNYLPSDETSAS